jgi:predicted O-methyltransferase YrrM
MKWGEKMNETINFTNNWFDSVARENWNQLLPVIQPKKILEIGSYEGASTCYLIEKMSQNIGDNELEIHCIDTWEGGVEHSQVNMSLVEKRFDSNIALTIKKCNVSVKIIKHKKRSDLALSFLLSNGMENYFDFAYIDGSHQAPDVLFDAVAGFRLVREGGLIAFDDYLWAEELSTGKDLIRCPKPAIDAFTNLYWKKIKIITAPLYQVYVQKLSS